MQSFRTNLVNKVLNSSERGLGGLDLAALDSMSRKFEDFVGKLGETYPGHDDESYMEWLFKVRNLPSNVAGPAPWVDYMKVHHETWSTLYKPLRELHFEHGCSEHVMALADMEKLGVFKSNEIPQFNTINQYLKSKTNFKLVNVGGMINARTFLYGLAHSIFFSTQYIRHHSVPFYSPEPDIVHELMGHVPLLSNKNFANFTRSVGQMAINADDDLIDLLAKVYFFTVEFGVVDNKIIGAGILGSCKESEKVGKRIGKFEDWNLEKVLEKEITLSDYQACYVDVGSVENLKKIFDEIRAKFE